jgi:hypothetical protein
MYILTVSVYIILIHVDSFNILLIETRTTHSISVASESMSSSSASSTPCSFVCQSGSLMRVCESDTTFCSLDIKKTFLRTRLPWARTALSTFGCANLILRLLCIHPSMLHICSHAEALVITEHNFCANHARLSKKTCPFSSMTSCMNVFTHLCCDLFIFRCVKAPSGWSSCFSSYRSYFFALITSCQARG